MKLIYFICLSLVTIISADEISNIASNALNKFALQLLEIVNNYTDKRTNIAISPYTIWTALSILNEGARGNTALEIERALGMPPNNQHRPLFRKLHQEMVQNLAAKQDGVDLEITNALFVKLEAKLKEEFRQMAKSIYNVHVEALNFTDSKNASRYINKKLSDATHGRLPPIVDADTVKHVEMLLTSALFFKGVWDKQFDREDTKDMPFYDDDGNAIANVSMMQNSGNFPFARLLNGKALGVELPYKGDRMSMIVMLPSKGVSFNDMLTIHANSPLYITLEALKTARDTFEDSTIYLSLPKFKLSSDIRLNDMLEEMNIHEAFGERANFKGIADGQLFISRMTHKSEIEVDEEGTTGSAVTVVEITDRIQAPYFKANRPFAFFIVDKLTHTILLLGAVKNPK